MVNTPTPETKLPFWERLKICLQFFTRLPIAPGKYEDYPSSSLSASADSFAFAGAIIGAIAAIILMVSSSILSPWLATIITLAVMTLITGALHEDGLADMADGIGGGHDREHRLKIMSDPAIGTYGALALIFSIILRIAALASLPLPVGIWVLILVHSASRGALLIPLYVLEYAKPAGKADAVKAGVTKTQIWWNGTILLFLTAIATFSLYSVVPFAILVVAAIATGSMTKLLEIKLGGYTGDGLGATQQIVEIAGMLVFAATLS